MKLGIEWNYRFSGSADEQARLIKENGFDATFVSRLDGLDAVMAAVKKYGIVCESYHAPFDRINDMWISGEDGETMLKRICDCIDACAEYGIPVVVVHLSSGKNPPRINDVGFERYDRLMMYAKEKGVTVAYENIRKLDNLAFAMENYPEAGFCWDVGHEACSGMGVQFMPMFGNRLKALHIHDNMLDGDHHMIPRDGKIDFDRVARQIAESPYEGSIMLELSTKQSDFYNGVSPEEFYERAGKAALRLKEEIETIRNNTK